MTGLTAKQAELLAYIDDCDREHGMCPSYEEMATAVGLKAKAGVHRLVDGLEERGYIRRLRNRARAIEVVKRPGVVLPGPGALSRATDADLDRLATDLEVERFARRRDKAIARADAVMAGEGA